MTGHETPGSDGGKGRCAFRISAVDRASWLMRADPPFGAAWTSRMRTSVAVQIGKFGVAWIGGWRSWEHRARAGRAETLCCSAAPALLRGQRQAPPLTASSGEP